MKRPRLDRFAGATILLALGAPVAAAATDALCYWSVRRVQPSLGDVRLAAHADQAAGAYLLLCVAFAAWSVALVLHGRRATTTNRSFLHWLVPLCVFVAFAWNAARSGYACNPF